MMVPRYYILLLLGIETIIFMGYYIGSTHGYCAYAKVVAEQKQLIDTINRIKQENMHLMAQINGIQQCPFYSERIAREQLYMAYPDEIVFVVAQDKNS